MNLTTIFRISLAIIISFIVMELSIISIDVQFYLATKIGLYLTMENQEIIIFCLVLPVILIYTSVITREIKE